MKPDQPTIANKLAIFLLLAGSIAYHVILGMSSGKNASLFQSGVEFTTNAVRNTIEPMTNILFSSLAK